MYRGCSTNNIIINCWFIGNPTELDRKLFFLSGQSQGILPCYWLGQPPLALQRHQAQAIRSRDMVHRFMALLISRLNNWFKRYRKFAKLLVFAYWLKGGWHNFQYFDHRSNCHWDLWENIFFQNWTWNFSRNNHFHFFRFKILLHFGVPDNQILLHLGVLDNQILLHFGVPDN